MVMLRAEKTTKNNDDLKVLLVGCVMTLILLVMLPMIKRGVNLYLTHRPFVEAQTLNLVFVPGSDEPSIMYDADAYTSVDSTWIASIETGNDKDGPRFLISGHAAYSVKAEDQAKLWTWKSWFDNGLGVQIPTVPREPFQVCIRYVSVAKETGVTDETPKKCSPMYDPMLKKEMN